MASRTIDMLEEGRKVVTHVFHGRDEQEARHNERSHRKADKSLDDALKGKPYRGVRIVAKRRGRSR